MSGDTKDVPVIRHQPGAKELTQTNKTRTSKVQLSQYGYVYSGTAQTNMVKSPADYTWDSITAITGLGSVGHIRLFDQNTLKFVRIPIAHSVWDD